MATYESNPGHLAGIWRSQDDIIMHISNQMVQIWEHCGFPSGHICACRPYMDRMESKPQRYLLVVRTPHDRAKDIDWGKAEWTVNIVGEPQLKIKGILIGNGNTWGCHIGWDITFYVDVLDVVKPENKSDENKNDTYKIGEDTMNIIKYMIQNMIQFNRCGGFTETELESTLKSLLAHYECEREEYVKYYKKLTPTKVIYNGPATIVIFEDGSKTVVKLQEGEQMDREKAVYAAICKHALSTNAHESNWLDMLKPLMKEADKVWRVKSEANALNDDIKKYSCKMEFDDYEDAAGFLNLIGVLNDKYSKREKIVANILGYPGVTALRKAIKAAREMAKDGK